MNYKIRVRILLLIHPQSSIVSIVRENNIKLLQQSKNNTEK